MTGTRINITFDCLTIRRYQIESAIRSAIRATLTQEGVSVPCEINVLVTNDRGIRAINSASRDIDRATDVLSFPMFQLEPGNPPEDWSDMLDPETGLCPLGDMALSVDHIISQAKEFGHTIRRETGYLTIHSILHLLGYDHMDDGEMKAHMRAREEAIASAIRGMQR